MVFRYGCVVMVFKCGCVENPFSQRYIEAHGSKTQNARITFVCDICSDLLFGWWHLEIALKTNKTNIFFFRIIFQSTTPQKHVVITKRIAPQGMESFFYSLLKKTHPNIHEKEYLLLPISAMILSLCRGGVHYLITITAPWLGNRDRRQEQSPHSLHEFYFNLISPTIEKKKKSPPY